MYSAARVQVVGRPAPGASPGSGAPDFLAARWAEVREARDAEEASLRGVRESGELVEAAAVRVGNALIELQERIEREGGLWLEALEAELGKGKQPWAWHRMWFARIPEDDRGIYLRRNRFSVKRAVVDYRRSNGLTKKKGVAADAALFPGNSPGGAAEAPVTASERDEVLAEVARRVEFAISWVDFAEAEFPAAPELEYARGELADDLRAMVREHLEARMKKRLLGGARS